MTQPLLMPKGVATWLINNTTLSFKQISDFCKLHIMEVQNLADTTNIKDINPIITTMELTKEEIERCEKDHSLVLSINQNVPQRIKDTVPKKTYLAHRSNKPNAILWLVNHHANISDRYIKKLLNTSKSTIDKIRNKTYKNYSSLTPKDPVSLGLCQLNELKNIIDKSIQNGEEKL